jgi:hypothetical protein
MTPSLCGSFLTDKRSLVAFTWTLTTVFTFVAFVAAITMIIHLHTHYKFMENYYTDQYEQASRENNQHNNGNGQGGQQQQHNSGDENKERFEYLMALSSMRSGSLSFAAAYTVMIAMAISLYGSTTIVGFTSLRGVYIQPCFSAPSSLKLGIFGGAIIFFANLLLVCAVVFGEVRVEDWRDYRGNGGEGQDHEQQQQRDDREPYEIERIATVLAVTCMFLAALYSIFAILLFLYYGSIENIEDDDTIEVTRKPLSSIVNDTRRENFITMGET